MEDEDARAFHREMIRSVPSTPLRPPSHGGRGDPDPPIVDNKSFCFMLTDVGCIGLAFFDVRQAQQCALRALSLAPDNKPALLLLVCMEMAQGNTDVALALLKRRQANLPPHLGQGQPPNFIGGSELQTS